MVIDEANQYHTSFRRESEIMGCNGIGDCDKHVKWYGTVRAINAWSERWPAVLAHCLGSYGCQSRQMFLYDLFKISARKCNKMHLVFFSVIKIPALRVKPYRPTIVHIPPVARLC